ncbi:uncharacterized protein V6R79_021052, partial [Siganus canaliculatus]
SVFFVAIILHLSFAVDHIQRDSSQYSHQILHKTHIAAPLSAIDRMRACVCVSVHVKGNESLVAFLQKDSELRCKTTLSPSDKDIEKQRDRDKGRRKECNEKTGGPSFPNTFDFPTFIIQDNSF